jgi:protease YdgD
MLSLIFILLQSVQAMVVGVDSRVLQAPAGAYSAVGMVETSQGQVCTGVLVGPHVAITAGHCLLKDGVLQGKEHFRYHSHFQYGATVGEWSGIQRIITAPSVAGATRSDWAILILEKNLGDIYGTLPVRAYTRRDDHKALLRVPGYDVTHAVAKNYGISLLWNKTRGHVKGLDGNGLLYHDAPTGRGASGGPLLMEENGGLVVIGITVAERREGRCPVFNKRDCHNLAVPAQEFLGLIP